MAFLPEVAAQTIIQRNVELSNHYFALEQESQDHEIGMHQTNPGSSINDYQYIEDFADTGNASNTTSSDLSSTDDSDDGCETGLPAMMNHAPMMKLQLQQLNLFKENFQNKIPPVWLFYDMFQSIVLLEKVLKT